MNLWEYLDKWRPEIDKEVLAVLKGDVPTLWEKTADYVKRGGKRIRPIMVLLGARESGGKETNVLKLGASIELLHTFTLIHDDIEDSSELRRGTKCLHKLHGIPLAINAGDAVFAKAFELASEYGPAISKRFGQTTSEIVEGQELDIIWAENNIWPTEKQYLFMTEKKTGALMGAALSLGGLAINEKHNPNLEKFGRSLGVAFQIQDDLLNLVGTSATLKDIGNDITEAKRSLMVINALEFADNSEKLKSILKKRTKDKKEISEAINIMKSAGALDYSERLAKDLVTQSWGKVKIHDKQVKSILSDLKDFVINRKV
ncbi:MAG: polyprenyl synthetase family protein [Candidatus Altiarchaeota archaeon]|nr:polyprenyl synthetase family protein [Candidatus Altiarchaeota archaeon]